MSVVINTNESAAVAANNLSYSTSMLQKSLNRLSSGTKIVNPADDAGGLAVSMKLSATANREGDLQTNIGDASSYAQTQDGALQVAGSILDRMSQLETLYQDPTKNSSDLANYDDEFSQLRAELTTLGNQSFNGVSLFGTGSLSVATTDDLGSASAITIAQQNLLGTGTGSIGGFFSDNFSNLNNWDVFGGSPTVSGNVLTLSGMGTEVNTKTDFTGPYEVNMQVSLSAGANLYLNNTDPSLVLTQGSNGLTANTFHSVKLDVDASGNASIYLDGSNTAALTASNWSSASEPFHMFEWAGGGTAQIQDFSIASTGGTANPASGSAQSNMASIAAASSLGGLSISTITGAIQDVATMRANNGAEQSRLNFASTLLTTNQTNLRSAISNITDVDVAAETTNLAKWNVLVQAGASMLTQANQSSQIALKLITG